MENEASFHRRVDFWFLLDSVTQVAHTQKGEFGVSGSVFLVWRNDVVERPKLCVLEGDIGGHWWHLFRGRLLFLWGGGL